MLFSVKFYVGMRDAWMLQNSVTRAVKGCVEEEDELVVCCTSSFMLWLCAW
jgi:hypothetical protein